MLHSATLTASVSSSYNFFSKGRGNLVTVKGFTTRFVTIFKQILEFNMNNTMIEKRYLPREATSSPFSSMISLAKASPCKRESQLTPNALATKAAVKPSRKINQASTWRGTHTLWFNCKSRHHRTMEWCLKNHTAHLGIRPMSIGHDLVATDTVSWLSAEWLSVNAIPTN